MTAAEMLDRATLVFVGVIEWQQYDSWPLFHWTLPDYVRYEPHYWKILRRRVRVELLVRGSDHRPLLDVYEISWTGGAVGDWNSSGRGDRTLFLVRRENGRYHVVRDWWRSIFPVTTGRHTKLPLDDSSPLWERIALMHWWIETPEEATRIFPFHDCQDPGRTLNDWRKLKLLRGLARHPQSSIRVRACRELVSLRGWGQDECWDALSDDERGSLTGSGWCCSAQDVAKMRLKVGQRDAAGEWKWRRNMDDRRILTGVNHRKLRTQYCQLWEATYPEDHDSGCPIDRPPPATIVTSRGDVPLTGAWPDSF